MLMLVLVIPLIFILYEEPTCFDRKENRNERGVDCGGSCRRVCAEDVLSPRILWSRSFKVAPGVYNAVSYVENPNFNAGVLAVPYHFTIFDNQGVVIAERNGSTYLMPGGITPVFEGTISVGERVPARTLFELGLIREWITARDRASSPLVVKRQAISNVETAPRVNADLSNESINDIFDIEVVSVIYDVNDNAIGASRTIVPLLPRQGSEPIVFTWPERFETRIERCAAPLDIVLVFDRSGSMAFDTLDLLNPQPLTDARTAALSLFDVLSENDRVGLITFATEATPEEDLSFDLSRIQNAIRTIAIDAIDIPGLYTQHTNIADGIVLARGFFEAPRALARPAVIVFTDGVPTHPEDPEEVENTDYPLSSARAEAQKLKEEGISVYTIGLGTTQIDEILLTDMASSPDHYSLAATRADLKDIYREISADLCEKGPAIIDIIPKTKDIFFNQP